MPSPARRRRTIKKHEKISFFKSVKAVFSGISISIFTPNRIGEFGGRIFHLDKANRYKAIVITLFGSYSKYIINVALGSIGFLFLPLFITEGDFTFNSYLYYTIIFIIVLLNLFLFSLYLNPSLLTSLISKLKLLKNLSDYIEVLTIYSLKELIVVLTYSFLRYLVFTFQYFLLLKMFGIELSLFEGFLMISITFFVSSVIPSFAWTEILVRSSIAISFIGLLSSNNMGIASATFVLWIINIAIPALIGIIFIFKLKFFRKDATV